MTDHPFDPRDETQPHDTGADRAAAGLGPVTPGQPDRPGPAATYSPAPDPRTEWAGGRWSQPEPTPERWFERSTPLESPPTTSIKSGRAGSGTGTVLAAALAAAVL